MLLAKVTHGSVKPSAEDDSKERKRAMTTLAKYQ